jgi:L-glyceraldehyde 3-phosphate reductase
VLDNLELSAEEVAAIDEFAADGGVDLWRSARAGEVNN